MIDRHLIGDVGLAVLLAMPTLALARPQPAVPKESATAVSPLVQRAALAERTAVERKFSSTVSLSG
jgi:hypothetical protein